jgi:hypothetical protein
MSTNPLSKSIAYIRKARTYETLQEFRDRINVSVKLTEAQKVELLFECDQQRGFIWFDSLPQEPVREKVRSIVIIPKKKKRSW